MLFLKSKFIPKVIFYFALLTSSLTNIAQQGDPKLAQSYLASSNFEYALNEYQLLLKDFPNNKDYIYHLGVCYLNTNIDKPKAIEYLTKLIEDNGDAYNDNVYYLLGRAYHFNYQFDEAIENLNTYIANGGGTAASISEAKKQIEYCSNAKELIKFPLNVKFTNLGSNINTSFADYFPFLPEDESYLIFNSKRPMYSEEYRIDEVPNSNIFISYVINGEFTKAKLMDSTINSTQGKEEIVGLSADGKLRVIYLDDQKLKGDLFLMSIDSSLHNGLIKLDETINSSGHEIAACISKNRDVIVFASDKKGGFGGTDLYISRKLPIGGWGPPKNLGPEINTSFDEDFPNLSADGSTIFFSSKGHASMGGYDIFKAKINLKTGEIQSIKNIGYPINTVFDDMNFRLSETGRYGYMSSLRKEGLGDYDIYRITFNEIETRYSLIKGYITPENENPEYIDVVIDVFDEKTGELYGTYVPNSNTMRYIMILPPGEYEMNVDAFGYEPIVEKIKILDKSSFKYIINKDILLKRN